MDNYRKMLLTFSPVEPFSCPRYSGSPVGLLVYSVSLKAEESQSSNLQFCLTHVSFSVEVESASNDSLRLWYADVW